MERIYRGNDVVTEGPGRYVRVEIPARGAGWARISRHTGRAADLIGPYSVSVLGWGAQEVVYEDFSPADRERLLTTLD